MMEITGRRLAYPPGETPSRTIIRYRPGDASESLLKRTRGSIGVMAGHALEASDLHGLDLRRDEARLLRVGAAAAGLHGARRLFEADRATLSDAGFTFLHNLLLEPTNMTTRAGRAAHALRRELGVLSAIESSVLERLIASHGTSALAGTHVFYNGHATTSALAMFSTLEALGLRRASMKRSGYSGESGIATVLRSRLGRLNGSDLDVDIADSQALFAMLSTAKAPIILVNAGPMFVGKTIPDALRARIERGDIRFILHNAADIEAFARLDFAAWVVDLASSELKHMEAAAIGEQFAIHAAYASLHEHHEPLSQTTTIIKGAGVIGGGVVRGLLAMGLPPKNIVVVDRDPAVLDRVRALGIEQAGATEPADLASRLSGIAIVATPGVGFGAEEAQRYPQRTVVLTSTSGGKGVDLDGLASVMQHAMRLPYGFGSYGYDMGTMKSQMKYMDGFRHIVVPNCHDGGTGSDALRAYPVNLANPVLAERLVTAPILAVATLEALATRGPGVHPIGEPSVAIVRDAVAEANSRPCALVLPESMQMHHAAEILASFTG